MSTSAAKTTKPVHDEGRLAQVLIAPIVSEKATSAAEKNNQVLFKVLRDATKPEIKAAVERVDQGTFGVCEECKGPILPKARLKELPYTRYFVACAKKRDGEHS